MTYARARLWLGVTGVGSLVTISIAALISGVSQDYLSSSESVGRLELLQLAGVIGLFMLWSIPLDFLGGFIFPKRFQKTTQSFGAWLRSYVAAAIAQALLFASFGALILILSQRWGAAGGGLAICFGIAACFVVRNRLLINREVESERMSQKLLDAITLIQSWEIYVPRTVVVKHRDVGFTGGIVGVGKYAKIIIPRAWLAFSREQLAAAIARRAIAIESGSYSGGLVFAFAWNVFGFLLCSLLPNAGFDTVAGLVTTMCGFTVWSFVGLLILPTVSRNASLKIDQTLVNQGMPSTLIAETAFSMDQMQDGEPERPAWVEAIFHPVPNVTSRNRSQPIRGVAAWNVARTSLFFSWGCLGLLSRSVHCNVGRPELWTMLPTD
jgi:hypothetical protein